MLELPVFERRGRTHDIFGCLAQVGVEIGGNGELPVSAGAILDHVTPLPRRDAAEENQTAGF